MTASDWTMQRLADLLDAPVDRPMIQETTALGAAYLAGLSAGVYPEPQTIRRQLAARTPLQAGDERGDPRAQAEGLGGGGEWLAGDATRGRDEASAYAPRAVIPGCAPPGAHVRNNRDCYDERTHRQFRVRPLLTRRAPRNDGANFFRAPLDLIIFL